MTLTPKETLQRVRILAALDDGMTTDKFIGTYENFVRKANLSVDFEFEQLKKLLGNKSGYDIYPIEKKNGTVELFVERCKYSGVSKRIEHLLSASVCVDNVERMEQADLELREYTNLRPQKVYQYVFFHYLSNPWRRAHGSYYLWLYCYKHLFTKGYYPHVYDSIEKVLKDQFHAFDFLKMLLISELDALEALFDELEGLERKVVQHYEQRIDSSEDILVLCPDFERSARKTLEELKAEID